MNTPTDNIAILGKTSSQEGNEKDDDIRSSHVESAAAAGCLAGFVVGGPIIGLAAAAGVAYLASEDRGKAGDLARKSGEFIATSGDRVKQFDRKHRVSEKASKEIEKGCKSVRKLDQKHRITEKTSEGIEKARDEMRTFEKKHRVLEKASIRMERGRQWISEIVNPIDKKSQNHVTQLSA